MIIDLTREQFAYIKSRLPHDYFLVKKQENKIELNSPNDNLAIATDDQNKCLKIIQDLKKAEAFRLLFTKELTTTFHKQFYRLFVKYEDTYKRNKPEYLVNMINIIAQFYQDTMRLFMKSKIYATNNETIKLIEELESKFKILFEPYQKKCQEQTLKQLTMLVSGNAKTQTIVKQKQPPQEIEKQELIEKLKALSQHQFKQIIKYLNIQAGEYVLDLDKLDTLQFRRLQQYVKKRVERKRLNKLFQKYCRDFNVEQDDYSYQSFVSDSNELN